MRLYFLMRLDISKTVQVSLLRVLGKSFVPLGGMREVAVVLRVIRYTPVFRNFNGSR